MPRKKQTSIQPELTPAAVPPRSPAPSAGVVQPDLTPTHVEFRRAISGEVWRVDRWDLLAAECPGLTPAQLPEFQVFLEVPAHARSWMIVRRLFGFTPLRVPGDGNPDDYRVWSRAELREALGLEEKALRAELDAVRTGWMALATAPPALPVETSPAAAAARPGELLSTDDEVLRAYGFNASIFDKQGRSREENLAEQAWFAQRVREWEKLFKSPLAQRAATQCLYSELRLRRAEAESWELERQAPPVDPDQRKVHDRNRDASSKRVSELEETYRNQLSALQEIAPWFNVTGRQIGITGALGEIIKGAQEWEARKDKTLLDGIFTALEIQVLMRTHTLMPLPQYRVGWVMYLNESKRWLWDRNGRSQLRPKEIEVIERSWREAARQAGEALGVHVPDLLQEGAAGEFDDLYVTEIGKAESGNEKTEIGKAES